MVAMHIFHLGQPALLYLVPACWIPVAIVARSRGEFGLLWNGIDKKKEKMVHRMELRAKLEQAIEEGHYQEIEFATTVQDIGGTYR